MQTAIRRLSLALALCLLSSQAAAAPYGEGRLPQRRNPILPALLDAMSGTFVLTGQTLGQDATELALGDLDGDADLDIFSTSFDTNHTWFNTDPSQGTFTAGGQSLGTDGLGVSLGDLDGDGDLDAFVIENDSTGNQVWINQGGIQAGTRGSFAANGQANGDDLSSAEWDHRSWDKQTSVREKLFWLAAEACLTL